MKINQKLNIFLRILLKKRNQYILEERIVLNASYQIIVNNIAFI